MAKIANSVPLGGFIAPNDSADTYATHDEQYGRGGFRSVATTTERDAIPSDRRKVGMEVKVIADGKKYELVGGTANSDWQEVVSGGDVDPALVTQVVNDTLLDMEIIPKPVITSFTIDPSWLIQVGREITSYKFNWSITNFEQVTEAEIVDLRDGTVWHTIASASGTYTATGPFTNVIPTRYMFQIVIVLNDGQKIVSEVKQSNWYYPFYTGSSALEVLEASDILNLGSKFIADADTSINFGASNTYKWIWMHESFMPDEFVDSDTGIEVPMLYIGKMTITNEYGLDLIMKGYRSKEIISTAFTMKITPAELLDGGEI